jgi:Phage integrase family
MVMVAPTTAIRRSELRGLQWADVDFDGLRLQLRRGLFRKQQTKMKTKASRKPVPILPELAEALRKWREETPYPGDTDWVFASPFTEGKRPYWAESALVDHIRPGAIRTGANKHIGWHTFRHSVASLLGQNGEDVKVVQELLRHATSRITIEVYQQAKQDAKRAALTPFSGIFVIPRRRAKRGHNLSPISRHKPKEKRPPASVAFFLLLYLVFRSTISTCPYGALVFAARFDLSLLESGGDDGARTRDLCRDS